MHKPDKSKPVPVQDKVNNCPEPEDNTQQEPIMLSTSSAWCCCYKASAPKGLDNAASQTSPSTAHVYSTHQSYVQETTFTGSADNQPDTFRSSDFSFSQSVFLFPSSKEDEQSK